MWSQQKSRLRNSTIPQEFVVVQYFPVVYICSWLPMELRELKPLPGWRTLWITMLSEVHQHIFTVDISLDTQSLCRWILAYFSFLSSFVVLISPGVTHNIPLLREIITHPRFISGDISTNFLPEVYPDGFKGHQLEADKRRELLASAAALHITAQLRSQNILGDLR